MPVRTVADAGGGNPIRIEVRSPLRRRELRGLPEGACIIQFSEQLTGAEHGLLGGWFAEHPSAELRVYGLLPESLDFLSSYTQLNGFTVDSRYTKLSDASGLRLLPGSLRSLIIDVKLADIGDLDALSRFQGITRLGLGFIRRMPPSVAGMPVTDLQLSDLKSLDGIDTLPRVRRLRLSRVTADLTPLASLPQLADLTLAGGGSNQLNPLADLVSLRSFAPWLVRGLDDVQPVLRAPHLEQLLLAQLRRVTALGDLGEAKELTTVTLEHMRGLTDLSPLASAPALRELRLIEMQHLTPEAFAMLAGHPTLVSVIVGLGSDRKNLAVRDALRIPGRYGRHQWPPDALG